MSKLFTASDAIDTDGAVFDCNSGIYTGETVKSMDGRLFRFQCYTCCAVYQMELAVFENNPTCKFCIRKSWGK